MSSYAVEISDLGKRFRRRGGAADVVALADVSLTLNPGELAVLLGPSGCGKTTLLRCIAGLERPDNGAIRIGGREVLNTTTRQFVPPNRRNISMMFQSYALWPHMTAEGNVLYPLQSRGWVKGPAQERALEVLSLVGLKGLEKQYPSRLSGGQQQRVALARAIAPGTELVLFDEPLSNVDAKVREQLRVEIVTMQQKLGFTGLYVTHDQTEAMELASQIVVMREGHIEQIGSPDTIYNQPATAYVADFVGGANKLPGRLRSIDGDRVLIATDFGDVVLNINGFITGNTDPKPDSAVTVVFRPEDGDHLVSDSDQVASNGWHAVVRARMYQGGGWHYVLDLGSQSAKTYFRARAHLPKIGDRIRFSVSPQHVRAYLEAQPGVPGRPS